MSDLKLNNVNNINAVNASSDISKINTKVEDTSKDASESTPKTAPETANETVNKHVVVYIGSSEFTDSTGHRWYHNDEKTYTDEEFEKRNDLHFMIKYGEMKHTTVTM